MPKAPAIDARRERVTHLATALPEAEASSRTGQHTGYRVRGKAFAYYTVNEHNDGRIALHVKIGEGRQEAFVASDGRFFLPKYMAHHGWVGLDLDAGRIDWNEVNSLLTESYRMLAPKTLAARLEHDA